ncbi:fimbria/pilus outer membrane usher protein [Escherichia coli]|uniref:fimbria/pilus outer membrane usher protein n=1 Tax=Escherichia coli TaxID=562 RepID=UPI0023073F44|nr:fimbria/pilus outer membrane usher protein [Escherichia coli]WCE54397.1 fimbria/pilus outer membrane usher protein [Escherichia coli]
MGATAAYPNACTAYARLYWSDIHGQVNQYTGVSGSLLEQHNLSYNIQHGFANQDNSSSGSVGVNYRGAYGSLNSAYSYDNEGNQQINYGISGVLLRYMKLD